MILIDKSNDLHKVVFTTNYNVADDLTYQLKLVSDSTNKEFEFTLENNLSNYNARFIYFQLPNELFANTPSGYYKYSITDEENNVLSIGKAYVKDIYESDFVSLESENSDEDFLVYNGE